MELKEALQKQINLCIENPGYKCGVFVNDNKNKKIVIDYLRDFKPVLNMVASKICENSYECFVEFKNGSRINVKIAGENCRGCKNHGSIIDRDIGNWIIGNVIHYTLIPMYNYETEQFEHWENIEERVIYVNI